MTRRIGPISNGLSNLTDEYLTQLSAKFTSSGPLPILPKGSRNSFPKLDASSSCSSSSSIVLQAGHGFLSSTTSSQSSATTAREFSAMKVRAIDADAEIKRLTEQLKFARVEASERSNQIILMESERDFFKIKWSTVCPEEHAQLMSQSAVSEHESTTGGDASTLSASDVYGISQLDSIFTQKKQAVGILTGYLREIESLKQKVAELKQQNALVSLARTAETFDGEEAALENELTSNVARVIAQTQQHLQTESRKLQAALGEDIDDTQDGGEATEVEEQAYQMRQKLLSSELLQLGESIELKEQLVQQLQRSQYQYSMMKAFYEQKLQALEEEMQGKQFERELLLTELQTLVDSKNEAVVPLKSGHETRLREELKKKDDELRALKKKQDDLNNLSQVQTRYLRQVSKLESDIDSMKKAKVDLTKTLQVEKKKHLTTLNDKAKEIERLKRTLLKSNEEVKRLGKDKDRAEEKAREAMREGSALRKKANDILRFGSTESAARTARKALNAASAINPLLRGNVNTFLTEEQVRLKKWLDNCISEINSRERTAESLRLQCEQQLSLVNQQEVLESQSIALKNGRSNDVSGRRYSGDVAEAEERLQSMDQQLKLRNQKICDMEQHLTSLDDKLGDDN